LDKFETFERRLKLISLIPRAPRSSSTDELFNDLIAAGRKISKRQLQKDLVFFTLTPELGVEYYEGKKLRYVPDHSNGPITEDEDDPNKYEVKNRPRNWYVSKSSAALELAHMDPSSALVFKLAERYLRELLPDLVFQNVEHYFNRAEKVLARAYESQRWLRSVGMVSKSFPLQRPVVLEEVVECVYTAIKKGRQLRVKSRTRLSPDEPREYIINPLAIVYRDPSIYLVWTSAEGVPLIKEFVLHRLTEAEVLDSPSAIPGDFTLEGFIEEKMGFRYFVDQNTHPYIDLEIQVDEELRFKLSETPLDKSQIIEGQNDMGWSRVTARVAFTHQLMEWIRQQGYNVKVIGPVVLRDRIVDQVRRMSDNYADIPKVVQQD
jgi:predicted DNA-binding transcriptional regulator YafY